MCCDEASTNIIEHAYGQEGAGNIVISYAIAEDEFTIVLRDNGQAFDPANVPPPPAISRESIPLDELANQMRIGGLGLHFIRNLMDEVTYSSDNRQGNRLVMVKKLQKDES